MKIKFNNQELPINQVASKIEVKLFDKTKKQFRNYVESIYFSLTDIRKSVRVYMTQYFRINSRKQIGEGVLPNMFLSPPKHGNMLKRIIYDKALIIKKYDSSGLKANITIPFGIDFNGRTRRIFNGKWRYAEILDTHPRYSKYNGFLDDIRNEYRKNLVDEIEHKLRQGIGTSIYRY